MGPALVTAQVGNALDEARVIRAQAQRDAAALHDQAQRDATALREQAYREGFATGNAAAAKHLIDLEQLRSELIARTERESMRAVLLVAAELLGATLESQPAQILSLLAPHLTRMRRAQQLTLHLHPDDCTFLETHMPQFHALCARLQLESSVTLQHDAAMTRGGCLLESNIGGLDARIETRLSLLASALGLDGATQPPTDSTPKATP
jgi:flagellar assembly protein FliH